MVSPCVVPSDTINPEVIPLDVMAPHVCVCVCSPLVIDVRTWQVRKELM